MKSFFNDHNDAVYVNIVDDRMAADGPYQYPRAFERAMWATNGTCVSDSVPDGVSFSTLDVTGGFTPEAPLSEQGNYCVATRPVPSDGGNRILMQVRIATRPEIINGQATYKPPIEVSPIAYQIVLDLEIINADRCAETIDGVERTVRTYLRAFGDPVEVRQLPTINIASGPTSNCHQDLSRKIPSESMALEIKRAVAGFPQVHQQFHLLYFNNLNAALPPTLTDSFKTLLDALKGPPPGYQLTVYPWMFAQGLAALSDLGWNFTPWSSIDDPSLMQDLSSYAARLPYRTQLHPFEEPVPLLTPEEAAAHAGQLMKICLYSSYYTVPVTTKPSLAYISTPSWPISADDPPAYLVVLPEQTAAPNSGFIESSSRVEYQICTRYCADHGYITTAGYPGYSWADETTCEKD